jgi:membrane protein DedA with SNARE-associated domain/membrane-associated phospholipid phosphatase
MFVPGTAILVAVGAVVGLGHLDLWPILIWSTLGAIVGDGASYWAGRRYKQGILGIWPISRYPEIFAASERYFHRHGAKSVAIGRFIPVVRSMIPLIAGVAGMRPLRFYVANILSAIAWAPAHILPGALLGASLGALGVVSGRLVAVLVGTVVLIVLSLWLIRLVLYHAVAMLGRLQRIGYGWVQGRSGLVSRSLATLLHPDEGGARAVLLFGAVLLAIGIGFVGLVEEVLDRGTLAEADAAMSHFVQALRTPWSNAAMVAVTMLGDGIVVMAVGAAAVGWLLVGRRYRLAAGLGVALGLAALSVPLMKGVIRIARPTSLYSGFDAFSFPSGHATFAATLYGILAWLVARDLPGRWRTAPVTTAALLIGAIAASRIYLAAHWPSDVLAGLLFGFGLTAFFALVFRRAEVGRVTSRGLAVVTVLALLLGGGWHISASFGTAASMYRTEPATVLSTVAAWRRGGWERLPPRRVDMLGEREERFTFQWGGPVAPVLSSLAAHGWRAPVDWTPGSVSAFLEPGSTAADLPVLPVLHDGYPATVTLIRPAADGLSREVLRLWPSAISLSDAQGARVLLGSVVREVVWHPLQLLTAVGKADEEVRALPPPEGLPNAERKVRASGGPVTIVAAEGGAEF